MPVHSLIVLVSLALESTGVTHHSLEVRLDPASHRLEVTDTIAFPEGHGREVEFLLNERLTIAEAAPQVRETPAGAGPAGAEKTPLKRYTARLKPGERSLRVRYEGAFDFGLGDEKEQYTRGFRETLGIVGPEGVFLAGDGFWYPRAGGELVTFEMVVQLPQGWSAVSQGSGLARDASGRAAWSARDPMEEIYLVGGPLRLYEKAAGGVSAQVYLRSQDDPLAGKYLAATAQYIKMYGDLIGPYAYSKFALVENFWETGYGMPSFTLLGSEVIRLPFILHSSYPHEILHNWWGNSVYVSPGEGNWSEGLTAYMADHLVQEQRGKGHEHRRATLQKYRDYVQKDRDFPLSGFRSRHSATSEAVGYGKTMMGFHMLRRRLGDEAFRRWAADFYRQMRGRRASFDDVRATMEAASGHDLSRFFDEWVRRPGAAELRIEDAKVSQTDGGYLVTGRLRQSQAEDPFVLDVPLVVQAEGETAAEVVRMEGREAPFSVAVPSRPVALHADPSFDLFRRLDARETAPSIGRIFGESAVLAVIPSSAPESEQAAWRALAQGWHSDSHDVVIRTDAETADLPADRAVWLLGSGNALASKLVLPGGQAWPDGQASLTDRELRAFGEIVPRGGHSIVVVGRHPADAAKAIGWILADPIEALSGLGRKLPHYGRYSCLAFAGAEPANVLKGEWVVTDSPLRVDLRPAGERPLPSSALKLPPRAPLAEPPPAFSTEALRDHVTTLASPGMEGRGLGTAGLDEAAAYIAGRFEAIGLKPEGDAGTFLQRFTTSVTPDGQPREVTNIIGVLPGSRGDWKDQSVVVGAHYDHLGLGWPGPREGDQGKIHPGADDNASGVAVMLELARDLASAERPPRTIVFAAFTGEEAGLLGSRHYAEHPAFPMDKAIGMINLDTVGRLGAGKVSVLAAGTATEWQHIFRGAGYVTGVESRIIPASYDASDQKSFIDRGVPAVQIFTEPHADYHRPGDTADKVDTEGLVKVASFVREAVAYLAERPEPLTVTIEGRTASGPPSAPPSGRRVSLGTVPDFGFAGSGVRVSGIVPGSPAEAAGLREGDVIIRLDSRPVASLKEYSDLLKAMSPGQAVGVAVLREGAEIEMKVTLAAR